MSGQAARADAPSPPWIGRPGALALLFLCFAALLASRNPGVILDAELWAEDGWVWYPEAYAQGWTVLFQPLAGYLQTVSRMVGLLAQALPLHAVPTFFNGFALALQASVPVFLVSSRMERAWPHPVGRLLFALLWIALPNTREVSANLTNAQWHLAALAFLVLMSTMPRGWPGRGFDTVVLVISGLSGPFSLVLSPVAVALAAMQRDRASAYRAVLVVASAAIQAAFMLRTIGERSPAPLGASLPQLARIVSQQIVLGPLIGQANMASLQAWWLWQDDVAPVAILAGATALAVVALWRGPLLLRMAWLFAGLLLTAALARPQISLQGGQWPQMTIPGVGQRYYYLPMLAWLGVLFALLGGRSLALRCVAAASVAAMAVGIAADWTRPALRPTGFAEHARAFAASPPGTVAVFPVNPAMDGHPMILQKR